MPEPRKAVFLSYAHEDTESARRIADALRAFGVEVWFDQSELRGGDAWDAKIRKQIHECALFVPIVSANTQARKEGYFRREWRLAVDRTHDMSASVAFIVPVVIDDTTQASADVPEEFLRYQWTRLAHGVPMSDFVEQIKRLLEPPCTAGAAVPNGGPSSAEAANFPPRPASAEFGPPARKAISVRWLSAVAGVLAIGVGGYFALRPAQETVPAASNSKPQTPNSEPSNSRVADSKSIAVLPFANLSDDKDASAFFSDGIHEDILTNLSNIRELRVVSRTSVAQYRATTKTMRQIGQELGVAYILEGSVRRVGGKVRVTGQLIRAATDEHIWARNFDRDLTDIFAIQSELSQAIAGELQAAISPQEKSLIDRAPTTNLAAYELVLKSRQVRNTPNSTAYFNRWSEAQQQLLQSAVQLDPNYAVAYADLAYVYAVNFALDDPSEEWRQKAKEAIDTAVRLAPDLPDIIRAQGDYYYYGEHDFDRAIEFYQKVARLRPNDPQILNRIGSIQRRQSKWAEVTATWRKLEQMEPGDVRNIRDLGVNFSNGRRFDEASVQARKVLERLPGDLAAAFEVAWIPYLARGSTLEMERFWSGLPADKLNSAQGVSFRKLWALRTGNLDEAIRLDRGAAPGSSRTLDMAIAFAVRGDTAGAHARMGSLPAEWRTRTETGRADSATWGNLAIAEALLGHKDEALRCARKAVELMPVARDAVLGARAEGALALVLAWTGDKDAAVTAFARALRLPFGSPLGGGGELSDFSIHVMKRDPRYAPLRGHPGWEALLNDPKNHEPLF